jgi:hypothetical protein
MQAAFFAPPFYGNYIKENAAPEELPLRKCLILAFDDHSECYLVADWENGEQKWMNVADVHIDCGETMKLHRDEEVKQEEPTGEPCPVCKRPMPD